MTQDSKDKIQYSSAILMLVSGVALTIAGFIVPPVGEISDSVLWFFAQTLIYAGSIFGIGIYVENRFRELTKKIDNENGRNEKN